MTPVKDAYWYRLQARDDGTWEESVGPFDTLEEATAAGRGALSQHWLTHRAVLVDGWEGLYRIKAKHYLLFPDLEGELRPTSC